MNFKPKVLKYQPEKEIKWLGNLWIPNLFDGKHSLNIKKINNDKILFVQKEEFSGILVRFLSNTLKDTKSGFELMNQALKSRAEKTT